MKELGRTIFTREGIHINPSVFAVIPIPPHTFPVAAMEDESTLNEKMLFSEKIPQR
jgi:hypothetical protein